MNRRYKVILEKMIINKRSPCQINTVCKQIKSYLESDGGPLNDVSNYDVH